MDEHPGDVDPLDESAPATCVECGADVHPRDALVYHGLVYHPGCVTGVTRSARTAGPPPTGDSARRTPGRHEEQA